MRSTDPHVSMVVDHSNETLQFSAVLGRVDFQDGFHLLGHRLDPTSGDPMAWALQLWPSKEGLLGIDF